MWCTKIWKFDRHKKLLPKMLAVTSGSLLEMVLESHIEIKRIPAVPESDTDESAATCEQTRMLRFPTGEWHKYYTDIFTPSPLPSCIRRTKYRLESLTVSTAMPGYSFTGACANSSPAGQEDTSQLQTRPCNSSSLFRMVTGNSGVSCGPNARLFFYPRLCPPVW